MASLGAVLEQYPDNVIVYITDPRTGVQRSAKWPPTISEIVEACNNRIADLKRREKFMNWGSANLQIEGPKEPKLTLEQLKDKYGEGWGLNAGKEERVSTGFFDKKTPTWDDIAKTYSADPSLVARLVNKDDA